MTQLTLRPDFKTPAGEINDILCDGRYVGSMTLLYRESDRICGSVQLEQESLPPAQKGQVVSFIRNHIQALIQAVQAVECDVLVTYSSYDHVIATNDRSLEEDYDAEWVEDDPQVIDNDPEDIDTMEMHEDHLEQRRGTTHYLGKPIVYELVIVDEKRNRIDYHIYDKKRNWMAEAVMKRHGTDVIGEIDWVHEPSEEEVRHVTDLVVSDFDENEVDTFVIDHRFEGEVIETVELTHEQLLNGYIPDYEETALVGDDYSAVLVRDDGDMLTYEIYRQSTGGLSIGTATVDISRRQLSGFIDFREQGMAEDMETIATVLLRELDKEKDYDTISLTLLYKNEPIDEIVFESEQLH